MRVRLDYEYPGVPGNDTEYPGSFVLAVDNPQWARIPVIGEAITVWGHWVVRVSWVLWSLFPDDDVVIHIETAEGYAMFTPTRHDLGVHGWREA